MLGLISGLLVIAKKELWSDLNVNKYKLTSQRYFSREYNRLDLNPKHDLRYDLNSRNDSNLRPNSNPTSISPSTRPGIKWSKLSRGSTQAQLSGIGAQLGLLGACVWHSMLSSVWPSSPFGCLGLACIN